MDDLITWLRAQIDEDERLAHEAEPGPWDPARVLREVETKRKIVNMAELVMWDRVLGEEEREAWAKFRYVLELTALPYSDRPGYLDTWRP